MINRNDVFNMLQSVGVKPDDKVTIHCSLKAIGEIEGGADGLIDAFCEYLSEGLFIVPTHTWDNVGPDQPVYDVRKTVPCIGTLAKVAAFRNDGIRSLHPTHSVAVFGKGAKEYIAGEEKSTTPAPIGGCLSRLYEENGKVLLVGVGHERNTYLHAVDERLELPNRLSKKTFSVDIIDYDGNIYHTENMHHHYTEGLKTCVSDLYPKYKRSFEKGGAVVYGQLGDALVYCCDARKMTDIAENIWKNHGDELLCEEEW